MIISKTPYRISFFGGGSDYPEWYKKFDGAVLSTTIDKHIYITCRHLPNFFDHKYRVTWSKLEAVKKIDQIQHKAVKALLKEFKIKKGLEIHYDGDSLCVVGHPVILKEITRALDTLLCCNVDI